MMNIYVAHSKDFDFKNELYLPLRNSSLNETYNFVFPHENSDSLFSSKDFFKNECDVILVEASYPKLGVGIEVGWADAYGVPILTIYKQGFKLSTSIKPMSKDIIKYSSIDSLISDLTEVLNKYPLKSKSP